MQAYQTCPTSRKPNAPCAYRCTIDDEPGTLGQLDQAIYFFPDEGPMVEFTVEMAGRNVCLLGEVGIQQAAALADKRRGGYVGVCTSRQMEVA